MRMFNNVLDFDRLIVLIVSIVSTIIFNKVLKINKNLKTQTNLMQE